MLYLFIDNATVEGALFKGNTNSKKLFRLIVRLRKTQLENEATISISHVSGRRMIAQCTDGISRGEMNEGVAAGAGDCHDDVIGVNALFHAGNFRKRRAVMWPQLLDVEPRVGCAMIGVCRRCPRRKNDNYGRKVIQIQEAMRC